MADISTAMTQLYMEGAGPRFALFRVVGGTSSDSVVLTTSFSVVQQAFTVPPFSGGALTSLAISGTTVSLAAAGTIVGGLYYVLVTGAGV